MSSYTLTEPSYLPPCMISKRVKWDVFLSFRGEDTITASLCSVLKLEGLRVFNDNVGMEKGDVSNSSLEEGIMDSALAVAIISPNYAASRWCLHELCQLLRSHKRVIPVFYQVDPSDVRRQNGVFGKGFRSLIDSCKESQSKEEMLRKALKAVGNLSGYPCRSESDVKEAIQHIVKQVLGELKNTPEFVAEITVGLDARVDNVLQKLAIHSSEVRFLGIHGTPGIGKTTLAKAAFNKLASHFRKRCFISNVREQLANKGGVLNVQNRIIQDLSSGNVTLVARESDGKREIKINLDEDRVLVVLDDVSDVNQLESIGIFREWFHEGSRIIITSRNEDVLVPFPCNNDELHEADKLSDSESLELFCIHAFGRPEPTEAYRSISEAIVLLTDGLPLALEVFGSSLVNKTYGEWEDSLSKLKDDRPDKLQGVLKISYDALAAQDKIAFLDISCLLLQMKMKRGDVVDIFEGCGLRAELAIRNLVTKSLMKISETNRLWMHDQIKDMGKQIVREESLEDPGKRSRLWDSGDIKKVLRYGKATDAIHGIVLDAKKPPNELTNERTSWFNFRRHPNISTGFNYLTEKFKELTTKKGDENLILYTQSFGKMTKLKLLQINYSKLRGNVKYIPSKLRCLQWRGYSKKTLSANIPKELRVLDVSESNLKQLWSSSWPYYWRSKKVAPNLAVLNLSRNPSLIALPDMSNHRHLKKLTLEYCVGLTKIHDSVGNMTSLAHINLRGCSNLIHFSTDVVGMKGLKELILSDCSKFEGLPHEVQSMKSLNVLRLDGTAIVTLPDDMHCLTQLEVLDLNRCKRITCLPEWIGSLSSLKDLSLNHTKLKVLPESIGSLSGLEKLSLVHCKLLVTLPSSVQSLTSLVELHLTAISLEELPPSICSLSYLKVLSLGQCRSLSLLPGSVKGLASITKLNLDHTSIKNLPEEIRSLKFLKKLKMNNCESLATLPESIGELSNLTVLLLVGAAIKQLPESIGGLENLMRLNLNKCQQLQQLPGSIGTLRSLTVLMIEETAITWLPVRFGMLESLRILKIKKGQIPTQNNLHGFIRVLPTTFCNLSRLEEFDAKSCGISGQIHDDFNKLSKLEILDLGYNDFHSLPSTMEGLCFLKKLSLRHCENLRSLPRLSSTLEMLICADCYALESICDLSNLWCLQELQLANCYKLADVPGLECLKSLRRLYMGGCAASALAIKRRLSTVTLKNLTNLSIPGSEIPDWFSQEAVNFATRPNLAIKNVIIAVVVSVDFEKLGDVYRKLPSIFGIQARIIRQNTAILTTTLNLAGVPRTGEDQLYLCRYKDYTPLVLLLKEGDIIQMTQKCEAADGVELKRWGIFLVFENDDDYVGNEDLLPLPQQSVTRRLARFFLA